MKGIIIKTDIYIKPDIKDFKGISFDKRKLTKGEEAHLQYMENRSFSGDSYHKQKF
jgi:hypothetical protein